MRPPASPAGSPPRSVRRGSRTPGHRCSGGGAGPDPRRPTRVGGTRSGVRDPDHALLRDARHQGAVLGVHPGGTEPAAPVRVDQWLLYVQSAPSAHGPVPVSYTHLTLPTNREV